MSDGKAKWETNGKVTGIQRRTSIARIEAIRILDKVLKLVILS